MAITIDLGGRVALVTGAARGLGAAIAKRLADAGATVVLTDIDEPMVAAAATQIRSGGGDAHAMTLDVMDESSVQACFDAVRADRGEVSILVNNAGVLRNARLAEVTLEDWDVVINTHLRGTMLCTRTALPGLIATSGSVVNISSGAVRGSDRGHASYSAAKAGIVGLTRTLAVELGRHVVRVNAVAPGAIESDMTRQTADQFGVDFDTYRDQIAGHVPLGRIGQPNDVADVVCFLVSDLSGYVTGETLFVTGGPGGGV
jgi:3-oxoacyl-[acyl-carrier protein] reductase